MLVYWVSSCSVIKRSSSSCHATARARINMGTLRACLLELRTLLAITCHVGELNIGVMDMEVDALQVPSKLD